MSLVGDITISENAPSIVLIADSTAAPVSVLYPFTGWASYLTGLAVGVGCIAERDDAFKLMLYAIPFNFYSIGSVLMVALIAVGAVKDFGPMKKAEQRAEIEGKLLRDGAVPLSGENDADIIPTIKERIILNFNINRSFQNLQNIMKLS